MRFFIRSSFLLLCILFATTFSVSAAGTGVGAQHKSFTRAALGKSFPNPFRTVGRWLRLIKRKSPVCTVPNIETLDLNEYKIHAGSIKRIEVSATAIDPEYDVITYRYVVSGGKIVGDGPRVAWDLTGAEPGTYTITASADDGCGWCGRTITRTITILVSEDGEPPK